MSNREEGYEHPPDLRHLSRERLKRAQDTIAAFLEVAEAGPTMLEEFRIIRLLQDPGLRQKSWYGLAIDPEDTSTTVGIMMRNAFEALDVDPDVLAGRKIVTRASWFVRHYLPLWLRGRKAYNEFLDEVFGIASLDRK